MNTRPNPGSTSRAARSLAETGEGCGSNAKFRGPPEIADARRLVDAPGLQRPRADGKAGQHGCLNAFRLAALHQITTLTGSLVLALAVAAGRLADEEAWALAHLDEDWNIELWGEDEDAAARRTNRFADMRAAALLLAGSD